MVRHYASICMAMIVSFIGTRPGTISAVTGAMALLMLPLVKEHGLNDLLSALNKTKAQKAAAFRAILIGQPFPLAGEEIKSSL